ncbi:PREDICTED: cyclin-dependent kinase 20-like [Trachymyrmex cornetzi]|uniref:Cyclin-dependent kinase 20 n=1 Tax=Trachymyrmex cornetzi TaxID=471704 RepID=A0A195E7E4_9HYME|nr:PREDICTED: cyclin-dependent kinase 20-like [Trachymyrmex cornetzi]XP_018361517.1 PREDICTED: cyclin-dependent kinase 20-like [Trachymyrmex cornetzi]XP_018361518.1 PREDICTED: cyclin-dependent kinase 20-like [Trachymyrmex cornetzi]XP_018361519.1 PREDICTED: cyclin-dependent kinase 20-like [Trachymyrmex cornetzi]KYN20777.1 Cell division protein kinase 20 [Trachymyrmex cornetzi]
MDKYIINGQIGEGAQGLVLKAHDSSRDQEVALKKILIKKIEGGLPTSIIREVKSLQQLKHPYVVELLDAFPNGLDFIMVFEYMPTGLWEVLRDFEISLTLAQIKTYMKMLLEGIAYVHGKNIMHRDLKPANLLISEKGILKIADFGLSRLMWKDGTKPYSHQVATRWYRAPELLYGARYYTSAIDIWSIGCIFGEMLNTSPLFPGETDIEQLAIVLKYLGSPTSESWPELTSLPDYNKITFPYHKSTSWENIIQDAQPEAIDLIRQILIYNSSKRLTAEQALCHTYFYSKPYPSMKNLIKPSLDHRLRVKSKEINPNVQPSTLFENLLSIV